MDNLAFGLAQAATLTLAAAAVLFVVLAIQMKKWWWLLSFLLILPIFAFAYIQRRDLKAPGLLLLASVILGFLALIADGDLIQDKHPNEPSTRTFTQRAFGCSGSAVWGNLLGNQKKPLEDWLRAFEFDVSALRTELGVAQMAIHASALSYLASREIEVMKASFGQNAKVIPVTIDEYQAVVIANDHVSIVAFRGTDNAKNWVENFKFIPAQSSFGMVHAGFLNGLQTLWPDITRALAASRDKNQPIWLTGHSLGGAMAALAAAELQRAKQPVAGVITFGQPPVGYPTFAKRWAERAPARLVRYVNHVDAVVDVNVPIALPWAELTHVGELRYFDTTGKLHIGPPPLLQGLRDSACAPSFEGGAEYGAHFIRRYLELALQASDG